MKTVGNYSQTVAIDSHPSFRSWPTRSLYLPGLSFQTGPVFGTVIRLGFSRINLTLSIGGHA